MEEEKKGFVVKDKRTFSETGEVRAPEEEPPVQKETGPSAPAGEPQEEQGEADYMPEINFSNFVISLSTTALFHFGDFADPDHKTEKNLSAAKQIIDTLVMLKSKTEGNLDEKEKNLMEGVLYELQMRYVKEIS